MSLNQIINDNSGIQPASWKNIKVNNIEVISMDIVESINSVSSIDIKNNLNVDNALTFGGFDSDQLTHYSSRVISGLTLNAISGVVTELDNNYSIKVTKIGDNVIIKLNKFFSNSAPSAVRFELYGLPVDISVKITQPIILYVGGSREVCIATVNTLGTLILYRHSGNFGLSDGIDGVLVNSPCISYNV